MGSEFQPKPFVNNELDPQRPEPSHIVAKLHGEETIVGLTTLSLGSEEDPRHIASFLEVVGVPDTVHIVKQPWHHKKARFDVYMIRCAQGNPDNDEPSLVTKRVHLFRNDKPTNAYNALDDAKAYVKEKLAKKNEGDGSP